MPRNMSFSLTTEQIRNRIKTVTRRKGWKFLRAGDVLNACVKCMGLSPGEQIERLGQIRVIGVRREPLSRMTTDLDYGRVEVLREGFVGMYPSEFVKMFCKHMGDTADQEVTRIKFEYLDEV